MSKGSCQDAEEGSTEPAWPVGSLGLACRRGWEGLSQNPDPGLQRQHSQGQ